jgi:acetyltransferase-like isoleucine patch superfamily enzyme
MDESICTTVRHPRDDGQIAVGRHTYYHGDPFVLYSDADRIEVGSFCSIAREVRILGGGEHATDLPSTYPLRTFLTRRGSGNWDVCPRGPTRIGNGIWIGFRALILSGVTIGHGAVIGAGAVVTKDVPAFAIVAGNPAAVVRYRFDARTIERLVALDWWNWPDKRIVELERYFYGDVQVFLEKAEALTAPAAPGS